MDMFSFLQDRYYKEIERKNALESRAQHHLSIWIILLSGFVYCLNKSLDLKVSDSFTTIINIMLIATFIFIIWSGIVIYLCFKGRNFGYFGKSTGYFKYYNDLSAYYKNKEPNLTDEIIEEYISEQISESTDNNIIYNENKTKKLIESIKMICITAIFLGGSFFFIFTGLKDTDDNIKVEIIEKETNHTQVKSNENNIFINNKDFQVRLLNINQGGDDK
ncbi:hypothetical protein ACWV26_11615 [Rummeliibacillus sp. JY-2-4R]